MCAKLLGHVVIEAQVLLVDINARQTALRDVTLHVLCVGEHWELELHRRHSLLKGLRSRGANQTQLKALILAKRLIPRSLHPEPE